MRYDKEIYFVKEGKSTYDEETGNYDTESASKEAVMASIIDTKEEKLQLLYNGPKQGALTIHIQNYYMDPYDYIEIGGKKYRVDEARKLRVKHSFFVSEVQ